MQKIKKNSFKIRVTVFCLILISMVLYAVLCFWMPHHQYRQYCATYNPYSFVSTRDLPEGSLTMINYVKNQKKGLRFFNETNLMYESQTLEDGEKFVDNKDGPVSAIIYSDVFGNTTVGFVKEDASVRDESSYDEQIFLATQLNIWAWS